MLSAVERRIHIVDIFLVKPLTQFLHSLPESLEMHDLSRTQEFDCVIDVRVIGQPQNIVIGRARFLLRYDDKCTTDPAIP